MPESSVIVDKLVLADMVKKMPIFYGSAYFFNRHLSCKLMLRPICASSWRSRHRLTVIIWLMYLPSKRRNWSDISRKSIMSDWNKNILLIRCRLVQCWVVSGALMMLWNVIYMLHWEHSNLEVNIQIGFAVRCVEMYCLQQNIICQGTNKIIVSGEIFYPYS